MLNLKVGKIIKVKEKYQDMFVVAVGVRGEVRQAVSFPVYNIEPQAGDIVIINTTAQDLELGTGGYDFIIFNKSSLQRSNSKPLGHIMKLRYTPMQFSVLSCEEEGSPQRGIIEKQSSLEGAPVIIGLLHSHLVPAVLAVNYKGKGRLKLVYLMTDGGALPIAFSKQVRELREKGLIDGTITIGQSFGGDLEAVNIYSGLLAAKAVFKADIIIAIMGPGIVGTNSKYGFSGIEQGQIANAVYALEGKPIIIPRVSFSDPRLRHQGLSHHTQTILDKVVMCQTWVGLPVLNKKEDAIIDEQIRKSNLYKKHLFLKKSAMVLEKELIRQGMHITTMGRSFYEDRAFFEAAWSSALVALELYFKN